MSNEQVVRDFCSAWRRRDLDEIMSYFTPDAVYHNVPTDPKVGTAEIRAIFAATRRCWTRGCGSTISHTRRSPSPGTSSGTTWSGTSSRATSRCTPAWTP